MTTWRVGTIEITPIFEVDAGPIIDKIVPNATDQARLAIPWLRPRFIDERGRSRAIVQMLGINVGATRILVDAGVGDGKARPEIPAWSDLRSGLHKRLEAAGFGPDRVDLITITHLHLDHVGWLTHRTADGSWAPTFPRTRHLMVDRELDYWLGSPAGPSPDALTAIEDSVRPVVGAGLVDRVAAGTVIAPGVSLYPSLGHTPGHTSVLIESGGDSVLVTGDAIHHPVQLAHPEWGSTSDFDQGASAKTRRALLARCADEGTRLFGSHFAGAKPYRVLRTHDGAFSIEE
jgi:glyoxylase-like metal-dependent hydrolase (beta-lactamase superfamily II)